MSMMKRMYLLLLASFVTLNLSVLVVCAEAEPACSVADIPADDSAACQADVASDDAATANTGSSAGDNNVKDPNLQEMIYDVGDGEQSTMVYVQPKVSTFYKNLEDGVVITDDDFVPPNVKSFSAKFINMSNKPVSFFWETKEGGPKYEMSQVKAFGMTGAVMVPGHRLLFTEPGEQGKVLKAFVVEDYPENIYYYDPYNVKGNPEKTAENLAQLTTPEKNKYDKWRKTIRFNTQYKDKTGRSYLANYLRKPPVHYMWPADYFGQEHWVTSEETHFVEHPSPATLSEPELQGSKLYRRLEDNDPRILGTYRDPEEAGLLNMTLKVLSCVPRVFEVSDFLSPIEVQHLLALAKGVDLKASVLGDNDVQDQKLARRSRSSTNTWIARDKSPIVDAIYRRAADLMRIDESLLRQRNSKDKRHDEIRTAQTIAEQLQLVHYGPGEEYGTHHDFLYTNDISSPTQGARFATLLLYLNKVPKGGETQFPRWVNAETSEALKVKADSPGKAVLFYSQLPDGNFDDLSEHGSLPVVEGEKWLLNLWVHSPIFERPR